MAYQGSTQIYSPQPQAAPSYYSSTPPAPPPKPSGPSTPSRGPPLPPPPPGQSQDEPSELVGSEGYQYQQQRPPAQQPSIPPIEAGWLPEGVREKTTSDLHHLLSTPDLQIALLSDPSTTHPAIPASSALLRPLLDTNTHLATTLNSLESTLNQRRTQTQSRLLALRALEQQHRTKIAETEKALEKFSPMALYQRLSASVTEQENLVRSLEESWLEGGGVAGEREVEAFVKRVKEGKRVAFLRQERKERWDEGRVGGWR